MNTNFLRDIANFKHWFNQIPNRGKLCQLTAKMDITPESMAKASPDRKRNVVNTLYRHGYSYQVIEEVTGLTYNRIWAIINYNKKNVLRCIF